jgi:hypothetical protein
MIGHRWLAVVASIATLGYSFTRAKTGDLSFGGRLIAADGGSFAGVHVVATDADGAFEAIVDSSGLFVGSFAAMPTSRVTVRVFSDSTAPRYHSTTIALGAGVPNGQLRIVLVPRRWTVHGGVFDGRDVAIDPVRATMRVNESTGYWRLTRRGRFVGYAVSWVSDSFPLRVAFRHERGDPTISARDSLAFWNVAMNLETTLGSRLFQPSSFAEIDSGADGVLVTVSSRLAAAGENVRHVRSDRTHLRSTRHGERAALPRRPAYCDA